MHNEAIGSSTAHHLSYDACFVSLDALGVPHEVRLAQPLRRLGELDAHAVLEHGWLDFVWHALVHDRAIPVPCNVGLQPLARIAPPNGAGFAARNHPLPE